VDIIAEEGNALCFIEVKYRKSLSFGLPVESVNKRKAAQLIKLARIYTSLNDIKDKDIRFDVVEADDTSFNLIKNAFQEEG